MNQYNIPAIAGRICRLRKEAGMTQAEAAMKLGIQRRSLSNIESGAKGCSIDLLVRIATVYHCSLDYLVFGYEHTDGQIKKQLNHVIDELQAIREML